jgi:hypothetical protein
MDRIVKVYGIGMHDGNNKNNTSFSFGKHLEKSLGRTRCTYEYMGV